MKVLKRTLPLVLLLMVAFSSFGQHKVTGVVYNNGEPAGGILVQAHRSNDSYYTSFDGKYEIEISEKTKWLSFTFLDERKRLDIEDHTKKVFNFSWDGSEIPEGEDEAGVVLKSLEQLMRDGDNEALTNYSLYREYFKQDDYKSAIPHWRILYKKYPKATSQIYIDGVKIMEDKMDKALGVDTKKAYLDSMMQIYDKRIKYLDNVGELMGRKAAKYLEKVLRLDLPDDEFVENIKKGYGFAEKSINESGLKTEPTVIVLYMQSSKRLFAANAFSRATILEHYTKAMDILEKQLSDDDLMDKAQQAIPLVETIIETSGALDCEGLVELYKPKYEETPDDIDLIKKVLKMLQNEDCDNKFSVMLSERLYDLEPSAEAAYNMARMFLKEEKYEKAFDYYNKAYTTATNNDDKALYYYEAAGLSLQQSKLQQARDLAKQTINAKPDYCEAYMMLGEIYAQSSKTYSDEEFERSTVFWLAVDYFEKAAEYADCKSDAESKAGFYENYFPGQEEVFFVGLEAGKAHHIGGWINETTSVRVKAQ